MLRIITLFIVCFLPNLLMAQGTMKITSGITLTVTNNGLITLENMHLNNDGSLTLTAGDGTIRFSGNTTTNISGTNQPQFDVLQLAKTGSGQLQLNRNITIISSLSFVSGLLNLNNNNILLQSNSSLIDESESSRIIGSNGGYIEITQNLNAPSSSNPGNLGAILSSSQNFGSTVIRRGHQMQAGIGMSSSIIRYFDIIPTNNSGLNASLRFKYFDAELNGLNENDLRFMKSVDNITWTNQGFTIRDATTNYVEKIGIPDFSRWTLSGSGPLPVHLLSFTALKIPGNKVLLKWVTENEVNNSHFEVQRSPTGVIYEPIGIVNASTSPANSKEYQFIDQAPFNGNNFYRLKQVDRDNRFDYSAVRKVIIDQAGFTVYPNPATEILFVEFANERTLSISVLDAAGKQVYYSPGFTGKVLQIPVQSWSNGVYHLRISEGNTNTYRIFVKQ